MAIQAELTKTWDLASGWVLSVLHNDTRPGTNVAYAPASENSNQAQTREAAASQTAPVAQSAQAGAALGISPELQQKFESLRDDIADVRRIVEQIAIRQEQMTESVVALQAAQQTLTQKLSPRKPRLPRPYRMQGRAHIQKPQPSRVRFPLPHLVHTDFCRASVKAACSILGGNGPQRHPSRLGVA
jgi:hypothetical protein